MASMVKITCACGCGRKKMVRVADRKRGWGKFYSKSCKAKYQERRTHQCADYYDRQRNKNGRFGSYANDDEFKDGVIPSHEAGVFGHGQWE